MRKLLIIEDDAPFRRRLEEILSADGWEVSGADTGNEGLDLARAHCPDVVICDLLMPDGNGFQVCRSLREQPTLRSTKVLVISGRQFESDRKAAFEAGADEYLAKPFEMQRIREILKQLAPGSSKPPGENPSAEGNEPTQLRFWGVRGSIPTPGPGTVGYGGNTSCLEVRAGGQIIILDAGTGMRLLGNGLRAEFGEQPIHLTVLLSHTHWDHIHGLPFFSPVYYPQNRIHILGYEGARHSLQNVLSSQMESPFFPIHLREVPATVKIEELREMNFSLGEVQVASWFANHPGICVGYKLTTHDGSLAFFPDNEPYLSYRRIPRPETEAERSRLAFAQAQETRLVEFLQGTEVLVMDTQYDVEEYASHIGWGHGCLDDVVELALKSGIKRLFMFHHDPDHDDAKISSMIGHARKLVAERGGGLEVHAAREGDVVRFAAKPGRAGTPEVSAPR
jgi:CheY-like chemotaxis protein/phosphoribosyl 1,2-cyclic phosphodiesterase